MNQTDTQTSMRLLKVPSLTLQKQSEVAPEQPHCITANLIKVTLQSHPSGHTR